MPGVFLAEEGLVHGNPPVYAKAVVEDAYAAVCLWGIEIVALILKYSRLTQH